MHKNQKPCRNIALVKMKFAQNFLINVTRTFSAVVFLQYLIWKFFMRISAYFALAWHHIWYNMCSMIHFILTCIVQVSFCFHTLSSLKWEIKMYCPNQIKRKSKKKKVIIAYGNVCNYLTSLNFFLANSVEKRVTHILFS